MNELVKLVEDMVLQESYQLFESKMLDLTEKYKNGEISKEEYQRLLEGWIRDFFRDPIRTDIYVPRSKDQQHEIDLIRRKRMDELRLKQKNSTITTEELKELARLERMYRRRQGDINQSS